MDTQKPTTGARSRAARLLALVYAAAFTVSACHGHGDESEAKAASIPSARVAVVQRGDISHVLTLAGQFQPYQAVDVHPKVSGYMR